MSNTLATSKPQQTSFVTGLAWSFIALSGFSVLLAGFQYIMFAHVLSIEAMRAALSEMISLKLLPPSVTTVFENMRGIAVALLAASLVTLLVSIALLKRHNWARITFAWIMLATAVAHIAGLLAMFYFMQGNSLVPEAMPPELRGAAASVANLMLGMSFVMGIAFAGFFAWVAKRLLDSDIKQEFAHRTAART